LSDKKILEINGIKVVSDREYYLSAYLSLKCDLELLGKLNEDFPKFLDISKTMSFLEFQKKTSADLTREQEKYRETIRKITEVSERDRMKDVLISLDPKNEFLRFKYDSICRMKYEGLIREMSLVYLVALFESYLQKILLISFGIKPDILMTSQKNITYEELFNLKNIDDARRQIMEKEIMIVNEDIEVIRQYFEKKFKIDMSKLVEWKVFKERFYRRNILLHNSGVPNKIYREKTGYRGEDKRLTATKDYLDASFDLFQKVSFMISRVLDSKILGKSAMSG